MGTPGHLAETVRVATVFGRRRRRRRPRRAGLRALCALPSGRRASLRAPPARVPAGSGVLTRPGGGPGPVSLRSLSSLFVPVGGERGAGPGAELSPLRGAGRGAGREEGCLPRAQPDGGGGGGAGRKGAGLQPGGSRKCPRGLTQSFRAGFPGGKGPFPFARWDYFIPSPGVRRLDGKEFSVPPPGRIIRRHRYCRFSIM